MAKDPHPADVATEAGIREAAYFTVNLRVPGQGNVMHELKTLAMARRAGALMAEVHKTLTRPLIYAITHEGRQWLVPDHYQPETQKETDMTLQSVTTIACAVPQTETSAALASAPAGGRYVSRAYTDRSNCRKAAKRHAEESGIPFDEYQIHPLRNGSFTFEVRHADAPAKPADTATPAPDAGKPATGVDLTVPPALDRIGDKTKEQIDKDRRALVERAEKGKLSMPKSKIKNPTSKPSAAAKALGAPVGFAKQTGAKARKADTAAAKPKAGAKAAPKAGAPGDRQRYDWGGAAEKAAKGQMPATPDFSAPTHERFRPMLAEVVKAAKAGDVRALKGIKINPVSSSPKAIAKYRDLCVQALQAKG